MSKEKRYPPRAHSAEFHCPHCNVYAKQRWSHIKAVGEAYNPYTSNIYTLTKIQKELPEQWTLSFCEHCKNFAIWNRAGMVYPTTMAVSEPNSDLQAEIQTDYREAAKILWDSPRASAALLRLALQKLCVQLGGSGKNINEDIGELVKKGLSPIVQQSLDALRITGNNAVHPGEINLDENPEIVIKLFELINFIAEKMITEPKAINAFYADLPASALKQVKERDAKI